MKRRLGLVAGAAATAILLLAPGNPGHAEGAAPDASPATTVTLITGDRVLVNDGKRRLTDDVSAAQIGAPAAYRAGLTGRGVRVAIIDSGIDAGHPDLAGRVDAAANFTAEPAGDQFGHGTHVASIVAGSGAASGGKYRGIAPDATLLDAKVCDQWGQCAEDAILAGLEWAAVTEHAPVANLSLGGTDTPGIDPLEQAVDTLSARTGTLFVVAAGNSGPGESTVGSQVAADPATLGYGVATWPHDDDRPLARTVTYHNDGPAEVTVDLALNVAGAPARLFTLSADHLAIPTGARPR